MTLTQRLPNFTLTDGSSTGRFDADLYIPSFNNNVSDLGANASLVITLKIALVPDNYNLASRNSRLGDSFRFAQWPADEWNKFVERFKTEANFWEGRFCLVLDRAKGYFPAYSAIERELAILQTAMPTSAGLLQKYVYRRNILCRFNLQIVSEVSTANKVLNVRYIVDKAGKPSENPYDHGSDAGTIDIGDTYTAPGDTFKCIAHEVGHMLGMAHIGEVTKYAPCLASVKSAPDGFNKDICYMGPKPEDVRNVMGKGSEIQYYQALPWRKAFEAMSGVPLSYFIVHPIAYTPQAIGPSEIITEKTPRWQVFNPDSYWLFRTEAY
jgi:Metallo-peptidase family M12B Reprolysin-like